jgi:sugar lactone lactonase YvrE
MRHLVALGVLAVLLGLAPGISTGARFEATSARQALPIRPGALAVAPDGGLYIADGARNQILERLSDGRFTVVAGNGQRGFSGDGGRAADARLNAPAGMVTGPDGTLYFADALNNRVRAISRSGTISTVAGTGRGGWTPNGSPARAAPILSPEAVAIGPDHRLYIAASGWGEVLRLERDGTLTRVAGVRRTAGFGVGRPARESSADGVNAIAFDAAGNVYLAGSNTKTLLMIDHATGLMRGPAGVDGFYPRGDGGLAATSKGTVLGMNTQEIVEVTPHSVRPIYNFGGRKTAGISGFLPDGLAVSHDGAIYTDTDYGNGWSNGSAIVVLTPHRQVHALWKR